MSADNGQIIRERKDGKFYLYSYQGDYTNTDTPKVFDTLREAVEASNKEWTEYGTHIELLTPETTEEDS